MTATQASDTDNDTDRDSEDICSDPFEEGCTDSLDDGEGWNGACGNCADRQYAAEQDDEEGRPTMSDSRDNWAQVQNLNYLLVDRDRAPEELNTAPPEDDDPWAKKVTQPWALFLGEDEDGLIIEGDLDAIADRIDDIQRYVHHVREQRR